MKRDELVSVGAKAAESAKAVLRPMPALPTTRCVVPQLSTL